MRECLLHVTDCPHAFLNATELLDIGQNSITGEVPPELGQLVRLGKTCFNKVACFEPLQVC